MWGAWARAAGLSSSQLGMLLPVFRVRPGPADAVLGGREDHRLDLVPHFHPFPAPSVAGAAGLVSRGGQVLMEPGDMGSVVLEELLPAAGVVGHVSSSVTSGSPFAQNTEEGLVRADDKT